ncbi:MAG: ABC1 kinase family protein, partial [Actinomycetota bacterium]
MSRSDEPTVGDLAVGSFTDQGPWVIDPAALTWRRDIAPLRAQARGRVPKWLVRRRVPPIGRVLRVVARIGTALAIWAVRARGREGSRRDLSHRLRIAFGHLGPTYIKLGQIVSGGEGLFPPELVDEFKLLRDRVPAEPFTEVRRVVEAELGRPREEVFAEFDREPIAAASIAQVHGARLRSGEPVVVKVQRPGIAELVRSDIAALSWLAPFLVGRIPVAALANPPALIELFAETIVEELDFRLDPGRMHRRHV